MEKKKPEPVTEQDNAPAPSPDSPSLDSKGGLWFLGIMAALFVLILITDYIKTNS